MPNTQNYRLRRYMFNAAPKVQDVTVDTPLVAAEITRQWIDRHGSWSKETFLMIGLNARHEPIVFDEVAVGTLNSCLVHPREIFRPAIAGGCYAILIAHTHPSGDATPSTDDRVLTRRISEAGQLIGIPVVDHVVVTPSTFHSCGGATGDATEQDLDSIPAAETPS